MSTFTSHRPALGRFDSARVDGHTVFGETMGLVAVTCLFCAAGAFIGQGLAFGAGLIAFLLALVALVAMRQVAATRPSLARTLLFAIGLLLGIGIAPIVAAYAATQPGVVAEAAAATGLFIGGLGTYGYATQRDLSSWRRTLLFALLGLIGFGLVSLFVAIPGGAVIYSVAGLGIFAGLTVLDFNRLRRAGHDQSTLIAASIFLDVLNVFQLMLMLLGGRGFGRRN